MPLQTAKITHPNFFASIDVKKLNSRKVFHFLFFFCSGVDAARHFLNESTTSQRCTSLSGLTHQTPPTTHHHPPLLRLLIVKIFLKSIHLPFAYLNKDQKLTAHAGYCRIGLISQFLPSHTFRQVFTV